MFPRNLSVRFDGGEFTVTFSSGTVIVLTWEEWMEMRKVQNSLIYTEPK